MKFLWKDYDPGADAFCEEWLDAEATRLTGLDDGWRAFHAYWTTDGGLAEGRDFFDKVICTPPSSPLSPSSSLPARGGEPVAAIAFGLHGRVLHVMELLVRPDLRGRGIGTAVLRELLANGNLLNGGSAVRAEAVIFPDNAASIRAFEKAGFRFDHAHPDGNALYYAYEAER